MNDQQPKQGALPFACERGFTQVPNAVSRHYNYYPQFNGNTSNVYAVILSYFNADYGYAFPTQLQLAQAVNMTEKTVGKHVKVLAEVGLINVHKNGRYGNQYYTFNKPIEHADSFFDKFPTAAEAKRKMDAQLASSKADKDVRKAELLAVESTVSVDEYDGFFD